MDELIEKYKTYDSERLLNILAAPEDYLPDAVEAARIEVANRNISQEEIELKTQKIHTQNSQKEARNPRVLALEKKTKTTLGNFFDTINPIQKGPIKTDKKIYLTSLFLGIMSLYQFVNNWDLMWLMLRDEFSSWDLSTAIFFIPILFLPIATLFFWRKQKIGWILVGAFLVFTVVNLVGSFIRNWNMPQGGFLSELLPPIPLFSYLMGIVVFGGILWVISRLDIREIFHINRNTAMLTYLVSGLVAVGFIYGLIGG